jgi:hypothetical protein
MAGAAEHPVIWWNKSAFIYFSSAPDTKPYIRLPAKTLIRLQEFFKISDLDRDRGD